MKYDPINQFGGRGAIYRGIRDPTLGSWCYGCLKKGRADSSAFEVEGQLICSYTKRSND
jgi:hypothetical protein